LYHEVLFTEWIPKTFALEGATYEWAAKEANEVSELILKFNNVIDLSDGYDDREYRIWIEFDNTYMFAYNMGLTVPAGVDWIDLPCLGNSVWGTSGFESGNTKIKCKFYPGRDAAHNSYVKVYGFDAPKVLDGFEIRMPAMGFRTVNNPNL